MDEKLGQKNPVEILVNKLGRDRLFRSFFWDAVGRFVWVLAWVWAFWLAAPLVVTGHDVLLSGAVVIVVTTIITYFRWRKLNG